MKYCNMVFWSMEDTILMEDYGLLFTVFISINIAGNLIPSSRQSKLKIL